MTAETWDWFRWINAGLAGLVVVLLSAGAVARWRAMPRRFKRITPWVIGTYVIIAYGSGEIAASDDTVAPGLRVFLLMLVLVGLIGALAWGFAARDYDE
ncbi:hypothetical protein L2K70_04685 [Nocardioides KLBMP 9356]|uniref:Uncharacterized protein n=1 Tax=Nocardioides potassii TaxID=2911371 RepID=A0ABS9H9J9_9ACTN|nr:hypothetical protein [Nocardioides potassii]MCF6376891.1 hypothetical protein [Nocardioides potassii]